MAKSKRSNYLIDVPFQLGFITRFVLIILITIIVSFGIVIGLFFVQSIYQKLDLSVEIHRRGKISTINGYPVFDYDKEKIQIYEIKAKNGNSIFKCYDPFGTNYKRDEVLNNVNSDDLKRAIGKNTIHTNLFFIILWPLLFTAFVLIIIISIFSLFFSHKMAGPVYRIRVSLDRMLAGDYDFKIRARTSDFFISIVDRLEQLRQQLQKTKK